MTDLYRDPITGDLDFTRKLITTTTDGITQAKQRLELRLSTNRGEWLFDTTLGLNWIAEGDDNQILYKESLNYIIAAVKAEILKDFYVKEITSVDYYKDNRNRTLQLIIDIVGIDNSPFSITLGV